MSRLGFTQPIPTGPYCGLFERDDAAMSCKGMPRHDADSSRSFELGGTTAGVLRKVLGEIVAASSLNLRVDEWIPALA